MLRIIRIIWSTKKPGVVDTLPPKRKSERISQSQHANNFLYNGVLFEGEFSFEWNSSNSFEGFWEFWQILRRLGPKIRKNLRMNWMTLFKLNSSNPFWGKFIHSEDFCLISQHFGTRRRHLNETIQIHSKVFENFGRLSADWARQLGQPFEWIGQIVSTPRK